LGALIFANKFIECKSDSFFDKSGDEVVFLEGVSCYFMTEYLQKVEIK
jgi:hypothetical protein